MPFAVNGVLGEIRGEFMPRSEHQRMLENEIYGDECDYYKPVRVIAVASGKTGTGKSNVAANLATALSEQGKNVVVFNADKTPNNINAVYGLTEQRTLKEVWEGSCHVDEILLDTPDGIRILPTPDDMTDIITSGYSVKDVLIDGFMRLNEELDVMILDVSAGISDMSLHLLQAAHEVVVIINEEPASIADASVLIKLLNNRYNMSTFRVLVNMSKNHQDALHAYDSLELIVNHQYQIALDYVGYVPFDSKVEQAMADNQTIVGAYPYSDTAFSYRGIAESMNYWPLPFDDQINLLGFLEKIILTKS